MTMTEEEPLLLLSASDNNTPRQRAYDLLLKLLIVGEPGVGKTSMALQFAENTYQSNYIATIGVDFQIRTIQLPSNDKRVQLQVWDTAGQERFNAVTSAYYKSAHGVMIVYDMTKILTFEALPRWLAKIREHAPADIVMMLVGGKCEMEEQRQVSRRKAAKFATDNNMLFTELSAKQNANLQEAFFSLAEACSRHIDQHCEKLHYGGNLRDPRRRAHYSSSSKKRPVVDRCCAA